MPARRHRLTTGVRGGRTQGDRFSNGQGGRSAMRRFFGRLALLTALALAGIAIFTAAPALAYNQPLNEQEKGGAAFISSCDLFMIGTVGGSPISGGFIEAIVEHD